MPYTMNGIGTWYYGKKNVFSYPAYCPHCNRYVTLSSYDTREWFVVLFVPILPLGKKRILDSCPACRKHRRTGLTRYLRDKQKVYAEAEKDYQNSPDDPETAERLLRLYGAYQDIDLFNETAPPILQCFPDNEKILTTAGMINYRYGRLEAARDCLERALSIRDDDEIRHVLGVIYVRLSDPDTAAEYFQFILDKQVRGNAGSLFVLVEAYQAQGRHQEALGYLDQIVSLAPEYAKLKAYKKSRKLSERYQLTGTPVQNAGIKAVKEKTPLSGKKVLAAAGLICLFIVLGFSGISVYKSKSPTIYLVNGLDRPYEIMLDGQSYVLAKDPYRKVMISEGDIDLRVPDTTLHIEPSTLKIRSPFWSRPFLKHVYVINPDAIALIEWNKAYYSENANRAPDPEWKLFCGKQLYVFDDVHFPFKPFPDTISSSSSFSESRVQVTLFDKSEIMPEYIPDIIEELHGHEARLNYMKKNLYYQPENITNLNNLYLSMDIDAFIENIRPGLDMMPVRVEWHRIYQQAMEVSKSQYDLVSEYKKRLESMPENSDMQYLYGRILNDDPAQASAFFKQSIQGPTPSAYGYHALGYDAMMLADYQTALGYYKKAIDIEPDNSLFSIFYRDMLIAVDQLAEAERYCRKQMAVHPRDYTWMQEYTSILKQQGNFEQAAGDMEEWCGRNRDYYGEADFELLRRSDRLDTAYLAGDFTTLKEMIGEPNNISDMLLLSLNSGEPIPEAILTEMDPVPTMWLLLYYISETRLGNTQRADELLARASEQFAEGTYEGRYISSCLNNQTPIDPETICQLPMDVKMKAVALTALGIRFPEHHDRFFDLAKRLNFKKEFPYHFLKSIHGEPI